MKFNRINPSDLMWNPSKEFSKDWALIVAGTKETGYNAMTIAWGNVGSLFDRKGQRGIPTATIYLRPQRYTKEFIDREDLFTIVFLPDGYRKQLAYIGTYSGRDVDKIKETGLTPVFGEGYTYFDEASKVFVCRKIYHSSLKEDGFTDGNLIDYNYPNKDFHEMYIGEIVDLLLK